MAQNFLASVWNLRFFSKKNLKKLKKFWGFSIFFYSENSEFFIENTLISVHNLKFSSIPFSKNPEKLNFWHEKPRFCPKIRFFSPRNSTFHSKIPQFIHFLLPNHPPIIIFFSYPVPFYIISHWEILNVPTPSLGEFIIFSRILTNFSIIIIRVISFFFFLFFSLNFHRFFIILIGFPPIFLKAIFTVFSSFSTAFSVNFHSFFAQNFPNFLPEFFLRFFSRAFII